MQVIINAIDSSLADYRPESNLTAHSISNDCILSVIGLSEVDNAVSRLGSELIIISRLKFILM